MASGKKGKKNKGKTLALTDFLQETSGPIATVPIRKSTSNWADEVEDSYDGYESSRYKLSSVVLPTAPKASRDYDDIDMKVPKEPPYMAYLSNLPYDVDEDEIADFFRNLKIANMKIPKDDRSSDAPKLKGFGYVEFEDRESLLAALSIPDTMLKSRRIRIEVATNADNDRRRGRMDMGRDRPERPEVTSGDWRAGPRTDTSTMNDDRRGFSRGEMTRDRDSGFSRSDRDRDGGSGFTRDRDSGFNRDRDRDGGFSRDRDFNRDRDGGFRDRDSGYRSRDEGFSRDRDEDRGGNWRDERNNRNMDRGFTRRNYDNDRDRGDNRDRGRFDDREDRDRRGGGGFRRHDNDKDRDRDDRNGSREKDDEKEKAEPRQRPKLNLAPRTKPVEPSATETVPSSIFGNAKPVDTTQREREIEEKLAKELEKPRDTSKDRKSGDETEKSEHGSRRARSPESRRSDQSEDRGSDKRQTSRNDRSADRKTTKNNDAPVKIEKQPVRREERRERDDRRERDRDRHDKELPKMKEPEPPNFAASNKFAFLETEDAD